MKHRLITLMLFPGLLLLTGKAAFAQDEKTEDEDVNLESFEEHMENWGERMEDWGEEVGESVEKGKPIPPIPPIFSYEDKHSSPKLGLYIDDIDFKDAYEMHYPHNYGVMISGVTKTGNARRAGLVEGDIIMEFDGEKVRFEDHLIRLRDSKNIGDSVDITFFRNEKVMHTTLTFAPEEVDKNGKPIKGKKKEKLSPGFGGGGPEVIIPKLNFDKLNNFLSRNGFAPIEFGDLILVGGSGHGNVGGGWFIGGMGAGYQNPQQLPIKDSNNPDVTIGYKRVNVQLGFGGVTITKKFPLRTERLIMDIGLMLGGGEMAVTIGNTDGTFSWNDSIDTLNTKLVTYKKRFFAYYPSVGLLVRVKNWFGIHGSVGYLGAYAPDEIWSEKEFEFDIGGNSPDILNGLSGSLGIWFGF